MPQMHRHLSITDATHSGCGYIMQHQEVPRRAASILSQQVVYTIACKARTQAPSVLPLHTELKINPQKGSLYFILRCRIMFVEEKEPFSSSFAQRLLRDCRSAE